MDVLTIGEVGDKVGSPGSWFLLTFVVSLVIGWVAGAASHVHAFFGAAVLIALLIAAASIGIIPGVAYDVVDADLVPAVERELGAEWIGRARLGAALGVIAGSVLGWWCGRAMTGACFRSLGAFPFRTTGDAAS